MPNGGFCFTNAVRILSDGGYLIEIGGTSQVAYLTNKVDVATGMRLNVVGSNETLSPGYDPTSSLRLDVAGKLVKKLVPNGSHVKKGEPNAEIEVMKMFMPLKVEEAGPVTWNVNEGAVIAPGDLLATLELVGIGWNWSIPKMCHRSRCLKDAFKSLNGAPRLVPQMLDGLI